MTFPRILGIELVGVVAAVHGDAPAVPPGTTVAALMGDMGRAFVGGYAEYALVPEHQLIALDTTLPWEVLGALPETFVTAAGSLEDLDLEEGETLLLRGATSSVGLACLELARAAGERVIATTRSEAKGRRLTELGAAGIVLEGDGFAERARGALPEGGADGAVDLIGGPAVLETLRLLRPGATACNSGSLSDTWVSPDFEPIAMIPTGRKLTAFHSNAVHDARVGGPLLRAVVEQVERGEVAPNIDAVYALEQTIDAHRRMAANEATGKLVVLPNVLSCLRPVPNKLPPNEKPPAAGAGGFKVGPVRTGRGTCLGGPIGWPGRREAPLMRHRPDLCVSGRRREARPPADEDDSRRREKAQPIKQTSRNPPSGGYQFGRGGPSCLKRCAPEDVPLGDLDLVEPERRQRLE